MRKLLPKWTEKVRINPERGLEGLQDDGFSWRRYGHKEIFGIKFPRSYYRCTHRFTQNCQAVKQVQRSAGDPTVAEVTYIGTHTCRQEIVPPPPPASPSSSSLSSSLTTGSPELPDCTSSRIRGDGDGEMDRIYRYLGLSGPDDLAISFDAWEPSKKRSASNIIGSERFQAVAADPFGTPILRTFLKEHANEKASEKKYDQKNLNSYHQSLPYHNDDKEDLFEKCLTTGNLDSLVVTANEDAGMYNRLATVLRDTDSLLYLEDEEGRAWLFEFSHLNLGQCYKFTEGWSSYVKKKQLGAGDFVFFQRNRTDSRKLFIGFRRCGSGDATLHGDNLPCPDPTSPATSFVDDGADLQRDYLQCPSPLSPDTSFVDSGAAPGDCDYLLPDPTSPATSSETLELTEKLQLRLPEHSITGFDPILVIYCGDNQDSEERYFTSYIFNELCVHGFTPLRYDLTRSIVTANPEMIYRSRLGIIIFSMNYACSGECLDGFVAIMDHLKASNLVILPVFFKVSLSDIRGQSGSFEKSFTRLENSVHASQVLKWRAAMIELTSINTYQYMKGEEVMLAKNIVRDVCLLLKSETNRKSRGMRLQLIRILSLLNSSQFSTPQIVGLWGMAGIGKTSIAREIFRTQAERYDVCYFLPDFHLMCQEKGLSHLRDEFFSKIFGEEKVFIDACDTKLSFTGDRFLDKKVLIVLDGVSNARDAEFLVGGFGWFSSGHKIILTSRNRQVLVQCRAKEIYEIQKLSEPESLHLCCQYATEKDWKGRNSLISELVNYASGNPLALRVLGSSLQNTYISNEKEHLRRLRQHPPIEIHDAFRRSFNGLDDNEKSIFLDLACFYKGENKDHVVNILDGCGFLTDLGICGLIDESLISLLDNKIEMPNFVQDLGRFVVCQEHEEAGKRSRLSDSNEIAGVLKNNSGTEAIEGIFFDASGLTFELSSTVFERMYRLRLLKLHCTTSENCCKTCLPQGLYSLPDELRLLHWERYPLGSLPRNFNPKNLVELNMPYSSMTKLWKGTKNLEKLKRIILSHSRQLTKFPRLSKAKNLEYIDLEGCTSLVKVNSSILHHHKLTFLSLKDCSRLRFMPTTIHLESLEVLNLSGCSELEDFQGFSPNLKELYLAGTAIREMPSSIGDLTRLVTLDLENCSGLQHLPPEISNLKVKVTLSAKRPASSMDLSSVEDTAPPYKRYRLKRAIESVILSLRIKKQEKSVSRAKNKSTNCDFGGGGSEATVVRSIFEIKGKLEDRDLSEEALVELLQDLEDWDITFHALQETDIGIQVYRLQKHPSNNVRRLATQLIKKWKETVDEWVRFNQPGDLEPPSLTGSVLRVHPSYKSFSRFHVLPERPGQPECQYYMKTGDCIFGNSCEFHHPKDRETHVPESSLSSTGLPLRTGFRAQSLEKERVKEFGGSKFGVSVKPRRSYSDGSMEPRGSYSDGSVNDAAIRIQTHFRGYKCRKQHLITRQEIVLIQARWRGYQVRKNLRNLVLSMGISE